MHTTQTADRSRPGFTLVELMVVVTIIGVMTALIIPEMKGSFQDTLLRSTAREMINVFELASSRAVSLNQVRRVRLEESSGRYVVERQAPQGTVDEFVPVDDVPGASGKIDERVTLKFQPAEEPTDEKSAPAPGGGARNDASGTTVAFYPDGTADGGSLVLRDRQGYRLQLRINPVTARVHIVDLEPEGRP